MRKTLYVTRVVDVHTTTVQAIIKLAIFSMLKSNQTDVKTSGGRQAGRQAPSKKTLSALILSLVAKQKM